MPFTSPFALDPATELCLVAAGGFFLAGLLTGAWKYGHHARSPDATSPVYVDLAHRAALLYSFAALLLAQFAELSAWSDTSTSSPRRCRWRSSRWPSAAT